MEDNNICRTCLQAVDRSCFFYVDTFDNAGMGNTIPKDVLQLCIPEMDLYISSQPGICKTCLSLFESFYNFKNRCLATEERIMAYTKKSKIDKVNLMCVVQNIVQIPQEFPQEIPQDFDVDAEDESEDVVVIDLKNENRLLSCNKCSFVTMEKAKLMEHKCFVAIVASEKYKCPYCDYYTLKRQRLSKHINSKHMQIMTHHCHLCDFKTNDASSLQRHHKTVHPQPPPVMELPQMMPLQFNEAPLQFADGFQELQVHDLQMHDLQGLHFVEPQPQRAVFNCMLCEFIGASEFSLQRHRTTVHGPQIQYCEFCPYQTKDKSNFRKHMYIHSEKPLKCSYCAYNCVSPYQLTKHIKKSH